MAEQIRVKAAPTATVRPLDDPYGIPHKWDSARALNPPATTAEALHCLKLIYTVPMSVRDRELLVQWFHPRVRDAYGEFGEAPRPSGVEIRSCIRQLELENSRSAPEGGSIIASAEVPKLENSK